LIAVAESKVATPSVPVLQARGIVKDFGGVHAVAGAGFDIGEGKITGLIGPNGAGKSTMVNIIAGALKPGLGSILLRGEDITNLPPHEIARRGIVRTFQLSSEFGKLTVLENLLVASPGQMGETFWGAMLGKRYWHAQERKLVLRARELLGRFAMAAKENEYAGNLSGGQRRLVEIMRGLMAEPKLLLLDEPLAGVNPTLAQEIMGYLEDLRDDGLTMLMVEHDLGAVERVCEPVIVMAHGKVLAQGTLADLRKQQEVLDAYFIG
jgi:ABC-type branched-subunit amino acid transport system ATPase component